MIDNTQKKIMSKIKNKYRYILFQSILQNSNYLYVNCRFTDKAVELTQKGKGKHHIGDFLPPEELKKFTAKVKAVKGESSLDSFDFSDYAEHKIKEDNIGYKLLQQAGWQEGMGLGSQGQGITAPVNKYEHNNEMKFLKKFCVGAK